MTITTLKSAPHLLKATLSLIEKAFHYEIPHHFQIDFAPLVCESNFHNCFIKIDENENVIAHIGVCEREILGQPVAMLGGIAVEETRRGEGHFQELMQDVLAEKKSDVAFFLLWSDQEKLYGRYGFHLCGTQIEVSQTERKQIFEQTKLHLMSEGQREEIKNIYQRSFQHIYTTIFRTEEKWIELARISSADLFIKTNNGKISSYFFMNKGQDLSGIIYEYGTLEDWPTFIQEISAYGKVWLGRDLIEPESIQYQFFMGLGQTRLFAEFVRLYTDNRILIRDVNSMKQEVYFDFNQETLSLEINDFLRGLFGPGIFEEIEPSLKPIFISGLESI